MKISINEVWNAEGRSEHLAVIEILGNSPVAARHAVWAWILSNRPDLDLAQSISAHGFHAIAVPDEPRQQGAA